MRIALIAKPGHENTGVGRYTAQLQAELQPSGHEVVVVHGPLLLLDFRAWVGPVADYVQQDEGEL